ncbi:hypothetical protein GGI35DRAFT_462682 [Trichoderma velutinum]
MPPFESPKGPFRSSQLHAWSDNVEPRMHDLLWRDYWQRFNTVQIPILGENDYFNNAMEVAKLAKGQKDEFERIFEERNKKRQKLVLSQMFTAGMQTRDKNDVFSCKDARDTVSKVCQTGCLLDFLRLLIGTAHGWEADAVEDSQLGSPTSNLSEETQAVADQIQSSNNEEIHNETLWLGDGCYEAPMDRQTRKKLRRRSINYYLGTFAHAQWTSSISDDTDGSVSDISVSERENKEKKAPHRHGKRKRDLSDDDVTDARTLRRRLMTITPSLIIYPSTPKGEIDWDAIDYEFLFNRNEEEYDDDDDDDDDEEDDDDEKYDDDEEDEEEDDDDEDEDDDDGYGYDDDEEEEEEGEGDGSEEEYDCDDSDDDDDDDERNVPLKISYFF